MVIFFTAALVVSSLSMAAILWLKRYELTTGHVFLAGLRPGLRTFFRRGLFWLERVLPTLAADGVRRGWQYLRVAARGLAARGVLAAERWLEQGLRTLREATSHRPARGGDASPFLREVAEHKKKLQEEREDEVQ